MGGQAPEGSVSLDASLKVQDGTLPEQSTWQKQVFDSEVENRKIKKGQVLSQSDERCSGEGGISASEQRSNLSYARSRPATTVIRRLDRRDDEAEQSTALTNDNVRITKDSSRELKACWRGRK